MHRDPSFLPGNETQETDISLWNSFREGNKRSFEVIFNKYIRLLYRYGGKITINKSIVEDCIQEIFMELWAKRESVGETTSIKYYLFASLRRKIVRKLKKENWHLSLLSKFNALPFEIEFTFDSDPGSSELSSAQKNTLEAALKKLSKREREIIYLRFYEEMSFKEITLLMEMKLTSVYSLLGKAISKLRKNF